MSGRIPLPGLTSEKQPKTNIKAMPSENDSKTSALPRNRNPFTTVAEWTPEKLSEIEILIHDLNETTSDFTRKRNPKNRYWKGKVSFKFGEYESNILKMSNCEVPYLKATNYGTDYFIARLQKPVADAIVSAAMKKDILATHVDPRVGASPNEWWMTINGISGRTGVVDSNGNFTPRDLHSILTKTESGVRVNLDLVFSLRLTIEGGQDRKNTNAFRIVPDCSRAAIKAVRQDITPPAVESQIPSQPAAKADVASQELIDALDALLL